MMAVTERSARLCSSVMNRRYPPHFFEKEAVRIDLSASPCQPSPGGGATRNPGMRRALRSGGTVFGVEDVEHVEQARRHASTNTAAGFEARRLRRSPS